MSIDQGVMDILARIEPRTQARARDEAGRKLEAETGAERLAAILDEVADTILPRVLQFRIGDTLCDVTVNSARVVNAGGRDAVNSEEEGREARLQRVAAVLRAFAMVDGPLQVSARPADDSLTADEVGHIERELRNYCDGQGWLAEAPSRIESPDLAVLANAVLLDDGGIEYQDGDAALLPTVDGLKVLRSDLDGWRGASEPDLGDAYWIVMNDADDPAASAIGVCVEDGRTDVQVIAPGGLWALAAEWVARRGEGE